jgi:hypothetical protein
LTHRVDDVVSGRRTPTRPLPAPCKSFRVDKADMLTSNEEILSDDGMVAGEAVPVPPPPHAITTSPTTNSVGTSFANLMLSPLKGVTCCLLPGVPGRECAGRQVLLSSRGDPPPVQSIAHGWRFVKRM